MDRVRGTRAGGTPKRTGTIQTADASERAAGPRAEVVRWGQDQPGSFPLFFYSISSVIGSSFRHGVALVDFLLLLSSSLLTSFSVVSLSLAFPYFRFLSLSLSCSLCLSLFSSLSFSLPFLSLSLSLFLSLSLSLSLSFPVNSWKILKFFRRFP